MSNPIPHGQSVFEVALSFITNETTSRNASVLKLKNLKLKSIEHNELEKLINININEIKAINLSTNLIDEIPIPFIMNFMNITRLYLDNNYIYHLPKEIENMKNLITLAINNNLLNFLPTSLSKLQNLNTLMINNNKLLSLPIELCNLKQLKRLYIHNNPLENIPCFFHELTELKELSMQWFAYLEPSISRLVKYEGPGIEIIEKLREFSKQNAENHQAFFNFFQLYAFFCGDTLNPNKKNIHENYLLNQVCAYGDYSFADVILKKKIITDLNTLDQAYLTPLAVALRDDQIKLAKLLVDEGAKLDVDLGVCGNHLNIATMRMNIVLIRFLLKRGANPNFQDNEGNSPLHLIMSIFDKNPTESGYICEILLKYKANPNIKNKDLWSPVHLAARRAQIEALKWMINYNIKNRGNPKITNKYLFNLNKRGGDLGWTPLHLAVNSNHMNIVEILQGNIVNLFKKNNDNLLARHVFTGNVMLYKILLREELNWVNVNICEKHNKSTIISDAKTFVVSDLIESKPNSNFNTFHKTIAENRLSYTDSKHHDSNQTKEELNNTVSYNSADILSQSDIESPLDSSRSKNIHAHVSNYPNEEKINPSSNNNNLKSQLEIPNQRMKTNLSTDIKTHRISMNTSENIQSTDANSALSRGPKIVKIDKGIKLKKEFKQKLLQYYKSNNDPSNLIGKIEQKNILLQRKKILNKSFNINERMMALFHIKSFKNYDMIQICSYSIIEDFICEDYHNDWPSILLLLEILKGLIPQKILPNAINLFKYILNLTNINPLIKHEIENIKLFIKN